MTTHDAAAVLDCTRDHVSKLIRAKRIQATRTQAGNWKVHGRSVRQYRRQQAGR